MTFQTTVIIKPLQYIWMVIDLDRVLTKTQRGDIFRIFTALALGSTTDPTSDLIRFDWLTSPAWNREKDVVFLKITPVKSDLVNRQRDVQLVQIDSATANRIVTYTRVFNCTWVIYGPNCQENAETIRNALFLPDMIEYFKAQQVSLVADVSDSDYVPELFNGKWWERSDLSANFNILYRRESSIPYINSADIHLYTEGGEVK